MIKVISVHFLVKHFFYLGFMAHQDHFIHFEPRGVLTHTNMHMCNYTQGIG